MKNKSDKFDGKISNKVPMSKADRFKLFYNNTLCEIKKDRVNFQKQFFEKVIKKLTNSKENNKVILLNKMIFDNNIENFRLSDHSRH